MSTSWNVTVGIGEVDPEAFDLDRFAEWSGVLAAAPQGGAQVVLTIPAEGLRQAVATGMAIVEACGHTPTAVDALTTGAFDHRSAAAAPDREQSSPRMRG
ncbi:hypothetical protein SAMN05443377_1392 [Propionibacterium cyclohexanicum]|uniref:Uncharacterized protein n=1 Tax=Propionibacterium cyclohexanicum TaxID=64702 RepID=A0A1H9U592_9ACTN|nr:hypothetical protein [Propionibacterium cyclohexanicum]SES04337.1 hypothetical protein SAMN05443377_1392 [Propionibacterium cyclohexanicum]